MTEAIWLAGAGILGAVLQRLVDYATGSGTRRQDQLEQVRQELLERVTALTGRLDQMAAEVDTWQAKYYDLKLELQVQRHENDRLRAELQRLENRVQRNAGPLEGPAPLSGGAA